MRSAGMSRPQSTRLFTTQSHKPHRSPCIQEQHTNTMSAAATATASAGSKRRRREPEQQAEDGQASSSRAPGDDGELRRFFKSWAWKREHLPDKHRFQRPYSHAMAVARQPVHLSIKQAKFSGTEGFASTVWDSSIVVAKFAERWPQLFAGRRCLDLSAGCGLVAVVMARLGAAVTATDLASNLQLLRDNCRNNGAADVSVVEHRWGSPAPDLLPPFDIVCCCDCMYVAELVQPLLASLLLLSHAGSLVLVAHGRNRPAEPAFRAAAAQHFTIEAVPGSELDETYQCSDVDVLRLQRKAAAAPAADTASTAAAAVATTAGAAGGRGAAAQASQEAGAGARRQGKKKAASAVSGC